MIEQSFPLGTKPGIFAKFSREGQQQIQEYKNMVAYHDAVNALNAVLEPHRGALQTLTSGDKPLPLRSTSVEQGKNPGSWREVISVEASKDTFGILHITGNVKFDDYSVSYSTDSNRRQRRIEDHRITHSVSVIEIDPRHKSLVNVWTGEKSVTKDKLVYEPWKSDEYLAEPRYTEDTGEQAKAIQFLVRQLTPSETP